MHEFSMVHGIMEIIEAQVVLHRISSISRVHLKMGELAALEPMTLTACFELLAEGTAAQGAELVIETLPVTARCGGCGASFRVTGYRFCCPECAGAAVELTGGKELYLESLEATCQGEHHEQAAA
jgi:hydrogenase nickel incorporation protein HypA/HybF